jgi:NADH-quinone oxidoreductase subunit J
MDLYSVLFFLLAALTGASAIAVVVTQNIVRAATYLLFALSGTAGVFFLLGADFIGATQLLIYVGGTLVLVVFGVMLTAQGPFVSMRISAAEWAVAMTVGLLLYAVLAFSLLGVTTPPGDRPTSESERRELLASKHIGASLLGSTEATPASSLTGTGGDVVHPRAKVAYLLPFEIVSVHLLVVLIGAAYLARAKRRRGVAQ